MIDDSNSYVRNADPRFLWASCSLSPHLRSDGFIQSVFDLLPVSIDSDVRRFIACQFALESAHGTSARAKRCQNYSGMKCASVRPTTSIGNDGGFAVYRDLSSCIIDYLLWLSWFHCTQRFMNHLDRFVSFLKQSSYCPESDYIDKILSLYHRYYG